MTESEAMQRALDLAKRGTGYVSPNPRVGAVILDKDGNLLPSSQVEIAIWQHLLEELKSQGLSRLPTEGEMMEACQQYYSRHNASSYIARRDSMGAKPIDETKQKISVANPLEEYSDEELEVMQKALIAHKEGKNDKDNS